MRQPLLLGLLAALAACPSGGGDPKVVKPVPPPLPGNEGRLDLPEIPAKIDTTQSAPMEGNTAAARSPILDILKAENDRQMSTLKKASEPAYY